MGFPRNVKRIRLSSSFDVVFGLVEFLLIESMIVFRNFQQLSPIITVRFIFFNTIAGINKGVESIIELK